ncbi:MAG: DUF4158 domain-containing protein [Rhodocyclaceae bacterium]
MPVSFLTQEQRERFGRYQGAPTSEDLARYFHLDDTDLARIAEKRGDHNRLGFAVQLGTVRYLGTFLDAGTTVPPSVIRSVASQLGIDAAIGIDAYSGGRWRLRHAAEIRVAYGYVEIADPRVGFRLTRWLYALCWTGTDRPGLLFERATAWLVTHKVLLPSYSTLERYIATLRGRVEERVWRSLAKCIDTEQAQRLERLLTVPSGSRNSLLDQLRCGPVMVSSVSLVHALLRLREVRDLGVRLPATVRVPDSRVTALARYAGSAKARAIQRMPDLCPRRFKTDQVYRLKSGQGR